jgi:hypothetical protein
VFKKKPNFLNSAPTSTESALRLLNTPFLAPGFDNKPVPRKEMLLKSGKRY